MKKLLAAAVVAAIMSTTTQAKTYNLTMSSSHPPVLPWVGKLSTLVVAESNKRLEAMGSPDRIKWTEAYGGSLYKFKDTLEAVSDGLTDMGWVGTLWEGSKMPLQNITYFVPFVSDDLITTLKIMNKMHEEVPVLKKAWDDQNVVFLGASGVETYHLLTNFPVKSVADLKGRKILAPGPSANWIKSLGAVPVNGALPTYYNQVQTGVAEGMVVILTGAFPNKHHEVAPYVTLVGIGAQMTGGLGVNKDTWDGLSKDVQKVLRQLGQEYTVEHAKEVLARYEKFLGLMKAGKAKVSTLPAEEVEKWKAGLPNLAAQWVEANKSKGAEEVFKAYMQAIRSAGIEPKIAWDKK